MIKKNLRDIYINSIDNEYKFLDIIKKYFNDDTIKKTDYKYDVYDYTSNKYKIELKTRYNISYNTYDFLIIPETKILNYDNNFIYIFIFYFDKDKELKKLDKLIIKYKKNNIINLDHIDFMKEKIIQNEIIIKEKLGNDWYNKHILTKRELKKYSFQNEFKIFNEYKLLKKKKKFILYI